MKGENTGGTLADALLGILDTVGLGETRKKTLSKNPFKATCRQGIIIYIYVCIYRYMYMFYLMLYFFLFVIYLFLFGVSIG